MDSCVIPLRHGGLSLVQTTDFFYPLVEDPYMMVSGAVEGPSCPSRLHHFSSQGLKCVNVVNVTGILDVTGQDSVC